MKTKMLLFFLLFPVVLLADTNVNYYVCLKYLTKDDPTAVFDLQDDCNTNGIHISKWVSKVTKPKMSDLPAVWPAAQKWYATDQATNTANVLITPAVQGLMDAYNKKLIAAGLTNCVVTESDLKAATTNRIKPTASASLE